MATSGFKKGDNTRQCKRRFTRTVTYREGVWEDYFANNMSSEDIMKKYNIAKNTFFKILAVKKDEIKESPPMIIDPSPFIGRRNIDTLARTALAKNDAQNVVEATLALMSFHVKAEAKRLRTDPNAQPRISIRDLTNFFAESAPYVLQKAENKGKEKENSTVKKINTMFRTFDDQSA